MFRSRHKSGVLIGTSLDLPSIMEDLATIVKDERWRTLIPDMATVISWKDGTVMVRRVQPSLTCSTTAGETEKEKAHGTHTHVIH